MKKKKRKYSRLNPAYLASRHAGPFFVCLALGLLAGIAWRLLFAATSYSATADVTVSVQPPEAEADFDWEAKRNDWQSVLHSRDDRVLLSANLRFAVKLAATRDAVLDSDGFGEALAGQGAGRQTSSLLFTNPFLADLGPIVVVTRRDLAENLDFQSLAAIVSDLDPPANHDGEWDFSFFRERDTEEKSVAAGIIAVPGPDDRYFRVFHRLHEYVRGRAATSPVAAWRTAVDELASRLEREAEFSGRGGFGATAKRELYREIIAQPALAANGLTRVNDWLSPEAGRDHDADAGMWATQWDRDTVLDVLPSTGNRAQVTVTAATVLHPVLYRRDTAFTRMPALAAATLLAFLAAREEQGATPAKERAAATPAAAADTAEPTDIAELPPLAATAAPAVETTYHEVVDTKAEAERQTHIKDLTDSIARARVQRQTSLLRLQAVREAENRVSREAVAARQRADALGARHDAAEAALEVDNTPGVPPEAARLFSQRDDVFARLTTLRQYCTEEHPFVIQARRELDVLETRLAGFSPDAAAAAAAEARATREVSLRLEWETAQEQADILEERQRRLEVESASLLKETVELEQCLLQFEQDLATAVAAPVSTIKTAVTVPQPVAEAEPAPAVVAPPQPAVMAARLAFAALPVEIPLTAARSRQPAWAWGLAAGLALGIVWILLRELFASRFRNGAEARRLTRIPVLAELPAYSPRSFRAAAATMQGEVVKSAGGGLRFIPLLVEKSEPPPEARRGSILPAVRAPRYLVWTAGLVILLLAGVVQFVLPAVLARQELPGGGDELSLPGLTIPAWIADNTTDNGGENAP